MYLFILYHTYIYKHMHACVKNYGSTRVRQPSEQILRFDPLQGNAGAGGLQEPQVQEDGCVSDL